MRFKYVDALIFVILSLSVASANAQFVTPRSSPIATSIPSCPWPGLLDIISDVQPVTVDQSGILNLDGISFSIGLVSSRFYQGQQLDYKIRVVGGQLLFSGTFNALVGQQKAIYDFDIPKNQLSIDPSEVVSKKNNEGIVARLLAIDIIDPKNNCVIDTSNYGQITCPLLKSDLCSK